MNFLNLLHKIKMCCALIIGLIIIGFISLLKMYVPYFQGDVVLARLIQEFVPNYFNFALFLSNVTSFPGYLLLFGISTFLTWIITQNHKLVIFSGLNFAGLLIINKLLKTFISIERPSSDLIHVVKKVTGSSFPSTSAIIYGAAFGWLVVLVLSNYTKLSSLSNLIILNLSLAVLLLNFLARVLLGAHWPSDIIFSYGICFIWIISLLRCIQ